MFDTVYVSMYKYFNAASGAVLAGPKALLGGSLSDTPDVRRQLAPGVAVRSRGSPLLGQVRSQLAQGEGHGRSGACDSQKDSNFTITRIAEGTNVFNFQVHGVNPPVYRDRLEQAGIVADASGEMFTMRVNPTWTRLPPAEIAARFRKAMG